MTNLNTGSVLSEEAVPNREELLRQVLASNDLPTLPTVASKLVSLTSREETTLAQVAAVVSQDVALCSKILKVANSAFYSFPQQIGSISQAISMLGTNAVQSLVLSFSFMSMNKVAADGRFDFNQFIERSLAYASMAKLIMQKLSNDDAEEVFVAGLLQNLGELVLACTLPEQYDRVLETLAGDVEDTCAVEASILGADHCFIGYEMAKHWNFPTRITLPILQHHDPREYVGDDEKTGQYVRAIYLSNLLVNILYSENPEHYHARFREEAGKLLGLSRDDIQSILESAHTEVDEAAANFGLDMENT
ncbi:MAG: HDOD domain-containing protein, partial [Halioglobus sp.]